MNGAKLIQIVRREYVESVRKKSFLFGLVVTPLLMVVMMYLPIVSSGLLSEDRVTLAIVDETGLYGPRLLESIEQEVDEGFRPELTIYRPGEAPSAEELDARVVEGELTGWIRIPADFEAGRGFDYHSESITNLSSLEAIERRFDRMLIEKRAEDFGVPVERRSELLQTTEMRTFRIGREGAQETDFMGVYFRAVIMVMILFFALIPTGQILMRSVIEEKSNRVIEVLLSSVTPKELMVGKIIGLGAVGLTLLGVWAIAGFLLGARTGNGFPVQAAEAGVFVLYFFPGYFFYAALLGTIGSICNAEREAQPFLTPISLMLILPVMLGVAIAQNPDHLVARILSFVPFFTPSLMLFRFTIKEPPVWEIAATWVTLLASTVGMFWASTRIFRIGILLTGKRPTIPEVLRWVGAR